MKTTKGTHVDAYLKQILQPILLLKCAYCQTLISSSTITIHNFTLIKGREDFQTGLYNKPLPYMVVELDALVQKEENGTLYLVWLLRYPLLQKTR